MTAGTATFNTLLNRPGCFAAIRRQLMLTTGWWTCEYDVWISTGYNALADTSHAITFNLTMKCLGFLED